MRDTERDRDIGRGRSSLPTGSLMQNSILGLQNRALIQREALNHWATQASRNRTSESSTENNLSIYKADK